MKLTTFSIVVMMLDHISASESRYCQWSKKSAKKVESCPLSESEIEKRANNINCEYLAKEQNCTKASNFKYHCLINEFENASFEVCAESYFIVSGKCAEYNTIGALVQPHDGVKCSGAHPPCPSRYISTDAYKYKVCYEVVKPGTIAVGHNKTKPTEPYENDIGPGVIAAIVFGAVLVIAIIGIISFLIHKKRKTVQDCLRTASSRDDAESVLLNDIPRDRENEDVQCKRENYQQAIDAAEQLKRLAEIDTDKDEQLEKYQEQVVAFMQAYEQASNRFEETQLSDKCMELLDQNGIAILTGQQGCGKTLTAVHIMKQYQNKKWEILKVSSYDDLLTLEVKKDTLVYIDNIIDGFLYQQKVQKWWHCLCYFYFERVKGDKNIHTHLLITAKESVIKEACAQIREEVVKSEFFLNAECFPLNDEEKLKILNSQLQLAKELKGIEIPKIDSIFESLKDKTFSIGFPLCAHLFAFETEKIEKNTAIFYHPKDHVIRHVTNEINNDDTNSTKTLFLFLLFHISQHGLEKPNEFDLRSEDSSRETLKKMVPEDVFEKMKPLNFRNLLEKAQSLEHTILIRFDKVFAFKHHIYLEGVSDYFTRKYPGVAVHFFPLEILRLCTFSSVLTRVWDEMKNRLLTEIQEDIPGVLSCEIFKDCEFQKEFSDEICKNNVLHGLLLYPKKDFNLELSITFWAIKFHLPILAEAADTITDDIEEQLNCNFYQARFGECCEKDKKNFAELMNEVSENRKLDKLKQIVWDFRFSDGKSILHMILSSDKPDDQVHRILTKLLTDADDDNLLKDNDHLVSAVEHTKHSRILCILEILHRQTNPSKCVSMFTVVKAMRSCERIDTIYELEFLVRICIIFAYKSMKNEIRFNVREIHETFRYIQEFLRGKTIQQSRMTNCINKCKKQINNDSIHSAGARKIPGRGKLSKELEKALEEAIDVLSNKYRV